MSPRKRKGGRKRAPGPNPPALPPTVEARREIFVRELLAQPKMDPAAAARAVGYSPRTAASQASRLLKDVRTLARLRELVEERARRLELRADVVLGELAAIATSNIVDLVDLERAPYLGPAMPEGAAPWAWKNLADVPEAARRAIKSLTFRQTRDGTTMAVEMHAKVPAIQLAMEHLGLRRPGGMGGGAGRNGQPLDGTNGATQGNHGPGGVQGSTPPAMPEGGPEAPVSPPSGQPGGPMVTRAPLSPMVPLGPEERRAALTALLTDARTQWLATGPEGKN